MNAIFRQRAINGIHIDDDATSDKHDSIAIREGRIGISFIKQQRFITIRRLENWLVSDWYHKRSHMGLKDLSFEPVRGGLFYSLRLGGIWVAADWWLNYFQVDACTHILRLEYLAEDLNAKLLPLLPKKTDPFVTTLHYNQKRGAATRANEILFDENDLKRQAETNPRWSSLQKSLY